MTEKKTYVWTDWVPEKNRHYLTPNKCYEATLVENSDTIDSIIDDKGAICYICTWESAHLDKRSWNITDRDIFAPTPKKRHPNSDRAWQRGHVKGRLAHVNNSLAQFPHFNELPEHLRERFKWLSSEFDFCRDMALNWFELNPIKKKEK